MIEVITALFLYCSPTSLPCKDTMLKCAGRNVHLTEHGTIKKCIEEYNSK